MPSKRSYLSGNNRVSLKFNSPSYLRRKFPKEIEGAISSDKTPDILYAGLADLIIIPRLAWNNQLADVSEVIEPMGGLYSKSALESVNYQNNATKRRSFYAIPIMQWSTHIHCWQDLLAKIGKTKEAVPQDWEPFWQFWIEAQDELRQNGDNIYGIGLPMSPCADTFTIFEQFLEAYNVRLLDENGKSLLDNSQVKQGIATALEKYTSFYKNKRVPPDALNWGDADNNVAILSHQTLMSVNPSMSIPGSQRQDRKIYEEQLATLEWPIKPSGEPMRSVSLVKQAVVFEASHQKEAAKNFLSYFLQPQKLRAIHPRFSGTIFPCHAKTFRRFFLETIQQIPIFQRQ